MIRPLLLALLLSSCVTNANYQQKKELGSQEFISKNAKAVEVMHQQLSFLKLQKDYPIIVSSIVNMNQLNQTSTFGRLVSEQISSKFSQLNYQVVEPKLRADLMIREDGEFLITRELKEIAKSVSAQAVVVGTYVENSHDVYINVKVVQPYTNNILAAYSYALPKAEDIKSMLVN